MPIRVKNNTQASRRLSVAASLASVKAEGLKPSLNVQKQLRSYVKGETSIDVIYKNVLVEIKHSKKK